jgi:hypothetical protein
MSFTIDAGYFSRLFQDALFIDLRRHLRRRKGSFIADGDAWRTLAIPKEQDVSRSEGYPGSIG